MIHHSVSSIISQHLSAAMRMGGADDTDDAETETGASENIQ